MLKWPLLEGQARRVKSIDLRGSLQESLEGPQLEWNRGQYLWDKLFYSIVVILKRPYFKF